MAEERKPDEGAVGEPRAGALPTKTHPGAGAPAPLPALPETIAHDTILGRLGAGGMEVVYGAEPQVQARLMTARKPWKAPRRCPTC